MSDDTFSYVAAQMFLYCNYLTYLCLEAHKWDIGIQCSVDPDQMLKNAASDLGLHCLH